MGECRATTTTIIINLNQLINIKNVQFDIYLSIFPYIIFINFIGV
jgi:hypothetical protein